MVTSINQPSSYLFLYNIFYSQAKLINPFKKRRSLFVRRFQFPKFKASSSSYCPLFSIFRSPSLIFINLLLRYFRQFHPPSRRRLFFYPNPTHQLSLNLINRFNVNGSIYHFTRHYLSKISSELFQLLYKYIRLSESMGYFQVYFETLLNFNWLNILQRVHRGLHHWEIYFNIRKSLQYFPM